MQIAEPAADAMSLTVYPTGAKLDQIVDPADYSNPANFVILANDNYDNGGLDQPDNQNTKADPDQDPDLSRFNIGELPANASTIRLTLSDPNAVRLIRSDGHIFYASDSTGDPNYSSYFNSTSALSSTRGDGKYLPRAFDGSRDFWVEGLWPS